MLSIHLQKVITHWPTNMYLIATLSPSGTSLIQSHSSSRELLNSQWTTDRTHLYAFDDDSLFYRLTTFLCFDRQLFYSFDRRLPQLLPRASTTQVPLKNLSRTQPFSRTWHSPSQELSTAPERAVYSPRPSRVRPNRSPWRVPFPNRWYTLARVFANQAPVIN